MLGRWSIVSARAFSTSAPNPFASRSLTAAFNTSEAAPEEYRSSAIVPRAWGLQPCRSNRRTNLRDILSQNADE